MLDTRDPFFDLFPESLRDLRRRTRDDIARHILARVEFLPPRDRTLVEALYRDGASAKELARLVRLKPKTLRHKVRKLVNRVTSPIFLITVRESHRWPDPRRRVAILYAVQGRTIRSISQSLNLSMHQVRSHLAWIGMQIEQRDQTTIANGPKELHQ